MMFVDEIQDESMIITILPRVDNIMGMMMIIFSSAKFGKSKE